MVMSLTVIGMTIQLRWIYAVTCLEELMADIDSKPLHPKNKILLYSRYLLSKLSWHFTVSSVSKTWVTENIDSKVNSYIRKWLDIPIYLER
jgi:hypothetical protein